MMQASIFPFSLIMYYYMTTKQFRHSLDLFEKLPCSLSLRTYPPTGRFVFVWMWHLSLLHKELLNAKTTRKVHLVKRFRKIANTVSLGIIKKYDSVLYRLIYLGVWFSRLEATSAGMRTGFYWILSGWMDSKMRFCFSPYLEN